MKPIALLALGLTLLTPPSGRPPIGPLSRIEPRVYDVGFEVSVTTTFQRNYRDRTPFELTDAPIVLPLIFLGTFSRIDRDSLDARLWVDGREDESAATRGRIEENLPFHMNMPVISVAEYTGHDVRWSMRFRTQVWASRIDDAAAQDIPWPREWPDEVKDGLKPQPFIESDDPIFAQTVQRVSQGQLRMVTPYRAAKDLVRYAINEFQVSGDGLRFGGQEQLLGMELVGAKKAAAKGRGSPHDLVCICVAMLRAAGIPARPVVGIFEKDNGRKQFRSWAEFYLPDCGWIPFDPDEMRGKSIRNLSVFEPWPEFGTMDDLNEFIPLSYHFIPPVGVVTPLLPAAWGWDPRPGGAVSAEQFITLSIISRGRGEDDPG